MGASNSETKQMKFYSLKAKVDETNTPHFAQTEKVDGAWKVTKTFDTMEGMLDSATLQEKEYKGAKFKTFVLVLNDGVETSKVELTHNAVTHNIINCLASDCNKLNTYKIYVDKKKSKDGKYLNGRAFVTIVGQQESLRWSLDPQQAPKREAVMIPDGKGGQVQFQQQGVPVWDNTKEKAFWEEIFITKIQNVLNVPSANNNTSHSQNNDKNGLADSECQDLPF